MRLRRASFWAAITILTSMLLVVCLFLFTSSKGNQQNAFIRIYPVHAADYIKEMNLGTVAWYLAGGDSGNVYLGNSVSPRYLLQTDTTLKDTSHLILPKPSSIFLTWKSPRIFVDSSLIVMIDRITGARMNYNRSNNSENYMQPYKLEMAAVLPVSASITVTKEIVQQDGSVRLVSHSDSVMPITDRNFRINVINEDYFSSDGMLLPNRMNHQLVYVYYYKNRWLSLDSNLILLHSGSTIDTNTHAKVRTATVSSNGQTMMAAPPSVINRSAAVWGNRLFIHSNLMADNEDKNVFDSHKTIDVYDMERQQYLYSIYLPPVGKASITHLLAYNNVLFVQYEQWLAAFRLNL